MIWYYTWSDTIFFFTKWSKYFFVKTFAILKIFLKDAFGLHTMPLLLTFCLSQLVLKSFSYDLKPLNAVYEIYSDINENTLSVLILFWQLKKILTQTCNRNILIDEGFITSCENLFPILISIFSWFVSESVSANWWLNYL